MVFHIPVYSGGKLMKKHIYGWCLISLSVLGCQRPSDFLYDSHPAKHVDYKHRLKEMTSNADLDILWVIDNSGSMSAHQRTVIANIDQFIDGLVQGTALRWRTAMISTTRFQAPFIGLKPGDEADYTMVSVNDRFKRAVQRLGLAGDGTEKMFDPVIDALTTYPKFVRPNAWLAIIVVSDAPEQSPMSTDLFVQNLIKIKNGKKDKILFYGFLNPSDWCPVTDSAFVWMASKFEMLLRQIAGGAYKLCDPVFGKNLANLGANLASVVVTPRMVLKDQPIPASIRVYYKDRELRGGKGGDWEYSSNWNAILFTDLTFAPGNDESVRIVYDVEDGIH